MSDLKLKQMRKVEAENPNAPRHDLRSDYGSLRHEVVGLRLETESLRPLKSESANLRARMADLFFANSEKIFIDSHRLRE